MIPAKILHWLIETFGGYEERPENMIVALFVVAVSLMIGWFLY